MSDWLRWLFVILATYRVARMIAYEEGPFSIFLRLRLLLGAYDIGANGEPQTVIGRGISCPLCLGLYFAALWTGVALNPSLFTDALLIWFGVAGAQAYLQNTER